MLERTAKNGLRLLATACGSGIATISLVVPCGSFHDTNDERLGASLLLSRLLTQGTPSFPTSEQLAMHLETLGGVYGAGIEADLTSVVANVPVGELAAATRAVVEMATQPVLPEKAFHQERRRLASQFRASWAVPASRTGDLMDRLLYPKSAEGRTANDLAMAIPRLTLDHLRDLHTARYRPVGSAIAIATPGSLTEALDIAEEAAAGWAGGNVGTIPPPELGSQRTATAAMMADLTYLSVAAPAVPRGHADADGLNVLAVTLGGGATSRLFLEVRERRGLCYGIGCRLNTHSLAGSLRIDAGVPTERFGEAVEAIRQQIAELAAAATDDEVAKAKSLLLGHLAMESDHPSTWARRFGRDLVQLHRIRTHQEIIASLSAVDAIQVRQLTERYMAPEALRLTAAGPQLRSAQVRAALDA